MKTHKKKKRTYEEKLKEIPEPTRVERLEKMKRVIQQRIEIWKKTIQNLQTAIQQAEEDLRQLEYELEEARYLENAPSHLF